MAVDLAEPTTAPSPSREEPGQRRHRRLWIGALVSYLVMVFVLITLNFLIPRAMPGDPIDGLLGQGAATFSGDEETKAVLREYYKLDGSLWEQYRHYLSRLAHGDLGHSIYTNTPVRHEIARKAPWTVLLIVSSVLLAAVIGVVAGVNSAWRRDRPADRALMGGLITVWQFPPYLLGTLLLFLFAVELEWLPLAGAETPHSDLNVLGRALDIGQHMLLPVLVLTAALAAENYLVMRAGMVRELGSDYLLLGRAKGLRERRLKYRYAARNAMLPLVALVAVDIGFAVAANVVVERVFSYPGLGGLMFQSIGTRDYPTIQGVFLVLSLIVVSANALADLLYRRLDPRTTR